MVIKNDFSSTSKTSLTNKKYMSTFSPLFKDTAKNNDTNCSIRLKSF